jgi:PAS domain S-box-containing protein
VFRKTELPTKLNSWSLGTGVGVLYAALALVWPFAFDSAVTAVSSDPAWVVVESRNKELLWVVITAVALAIAVRFLHKAVLEAKSASRSKDLQVADLFFHHPKPMYVFATVTLRFLRVNRAALAYYGYEEAEFLAMTLTNLHPQEDATEVRARVTRGAREYHDVGVVRHRKKSGEIVYANITAHNISDSGRAARMAMAVEVTQEVLAKRALELQELQFKQLHESLTEVLWLASPDGAEVLYVSPAVRDVFGHPAAAVKSNPDLWQEIVHPDDRAQAKASVVRLKAIGRSDCEYRVVRPDGSIRWVADRRRAIRDSAGRVTMVGGIAEDITAAKERDAALSTTRVELENMVQARTEELQHAYAELDAFTRTAAHDLKTPLNGVMGFSQLLKKSRASSLDDEALRILTRIEESARSMAELVDGLFALSRVTTANLSLQRVDLAELAWSVFGELCLQEPGRDIHLSAPDSLWVVCDPRLARSLISNLIGNAWKYTGKRSQALISMSEQPLGDDSSICIEDNGSGFEAGDPGRVFKPFERFHSAAEFTGTGIGLATCQRIILRHGGKFRVTSKPDVGTKVWLTLGAAQVERVSCFSTL